MSSSKGPVRNAPSSLVRLACDRCHGKKLRCTGRRNPCDRCAREGVSCVFSPAGKSGRPSKTTKPSEPSSEHSTPQSLQNQASYDNPAEALPSSNGGSNDLPSNLFDDLETIDVSIQAQNEPPINDPSQMPDFDFSTFLLMPDSTTNFDEPTQPSEPFPGEEVVYEMLEHLTRLQSRLLNHRTSLSSARTALLRPPAANKPTTTPPPLSSILDPFLSDAHQVADITVHLHTQGSRFRHREHALLQTLSLDTSSLLISAPVFLMLDLFRILLALLDAAAAEAKPRSPFAAAESPACTCCNPLARVGPPPHLLPSSSSSSSAAAAAGAERHPPNGHHRRQSSASASKTPILDAFSGSSSSSSSSSSLSVSSPALRLWGLAGTVEYEVGRLREAVRVVETRFPLASVRGLMGGVIASMAGEMDGVLRVVGEVKRKCIVL